MLPLVSLLAFSTYLVSALSLNTDIDTCSCITTVASTFANSEAVSNAVSNAVTPAGYVNTANNGQKWTPGDGSLGFVDIDEYDSTVCAGICDTIKECATFQIYFEKGSGDKSQVKCAFWGGVVSSDNTNHNISNAIAGVNTYTTGKVVPPTGYEAPKWHGSAVFDYMSDPEAKKSFINSKVFQDGWFDTTRCADETTAQGGQWFNTYLLSKDGVPQGQYCDIYSKALPVSSASNAGKPGKPDGKSNISISNSYSCGKPKDTESEPKDSSWFNWSPSGSSSVKPITTGTSTGASGVKPTITDPSNGKDSSSSTSRGTGNPSSSSRSSESSTSYILPFPDDSTSSRPSSSFSFTGRPSNSDSSFTGSFTGRPSFTDSSPYSDGSSFTGRPTDSSSNSDSASHSGSFLGTSTSHGQPPFGTSSTYSSDSTTTSRPVSGTTTSSGTETTTTTANGQSAITVTTTSSTTVAAVVNPASGAPFALQVNVAAKLPKRATSAVGFSRENAIIVDSGASAYAFDFQGGNLKLYGSDFTFGVAQANGLQTLKKISPGSSNAMAGGFTNNGGSIGYPGANFCVKDGLFNVVFGAVPSDCAPATVVQNGDHAAYNTALSPSTTPSTTTTTTAPVAPGTMTSTTTTPEVQGATTTTHPGVQYTTTTTSSTTSTTIPLAPDATTTTTSDAPGATTTTSSTTTTTSTTTSATTSEVPACWDTITLPDGEVHSYTKACGPSPETTSSSTITTTSTPTNPAADVPTTTSTTTTSTTSESPTTTTSEPAATTTTTTAPEESCWSTTALPNGSPHSFTFACGSSAPTTTTMSEPTTTTMSEEAATTTHHEVPTTTTSEPTTTTTTHHEDSTTTTSPEPTTTTTSEPATTITTQGHQETTTTTTNAETTTTTSHEYQQGTTTTTRPEEDGSSTTTTTPTTTSESTSTTHTTTPEYTIFETTFPGTTTTRPHRPSGTAYIQISQGPKRDGKRDEDEDLTGYMAVSGDEIIVVDNVEDGTKFAITEEGYLTTGDQYVGVSESSLDYTTFSVFSEDEMDDAILQTWSLASGSLSFSNVGFGFDSGGFAGFYASSGSLVAATQRAPDGEHYKPVTVSMVQGNEEEDSDDTPTDELPTPTPHPENNSTIPGNNTLPEHNSTRPSTDGPETSFNGTHLLSYNETYPSVNGTHPPAFNASYPSYNSTDQPTFNGTYPSMNGTNGTAYNGTYDYASGWNKTESNAKAWDAASIIRAETLTDFCSTLLGYTTPVTTEYVPVTVTEPVSVTITAGTLTSGVTETTTTVPTTITVTSADSSWQRLRQRDVESAPLVTPAALASFDDGSLSMACSWKAKPVTTTSTTSITTTDTAYTTVYITVPESTVPATTEVLTATSTFTINSCEPTAPSQLVKNPSFECYTAGWDVGYTGSELYWGPPGVAAPELDAEAAAYIDSHKSNGAQSGAPGSGAASSEPSSAVPSTSRFIKRQSEAAPAEASAYPHDDGKFLPNEPAYDGNTFVRLSPTNSDDTGLGQNIDNLDAGSYWMAYKYRVPEYALNNDQCTLIVYVNGIEVHGPGIDSLASATDGWQRAGGFFTVPEELAGPSYLWMNFYCPPLSFKDKRDDSDQLGSGDEVEPTVPLVDIDYIRMGLDDGGWSEYRNTQPGESDAGAATVSADVANSPLLGGSSAHGSDDGSPSQGQGAADSSNSHIEEGELSEQ